MLMDKVCDAALLRAPFIREEETVSGTINREGQTVKPNPASPASYANTLPLNYRDLFFSNNQKFGHQIKVLMSYIWECNWCTPIFKKIKKRKKREEKMKIHQMILFIFSSWICPDEFVMIAYNITAVLCSKSDRKRSDCIGFFNHTARNRWNRNQTILEFWSHTSQQTKHTSNHTGFLITTRNWQNTHQTILDFWTHNSQQTKHTFNHTGFWNTWRNNKHTSNLEIQDL